MLYISNTVIPIMPVEEKKYINIMDISDNTINVQVLNKGPQHVRGLWFVLTCFDGRHLG